MKKYDTEHILKVMANKGATYSIINKKGEFVSGEYKNAGMELKFQLIEQRQGYGLFVKVGGKKYIKMFYGGRDEAANELLSIFRLFIGLSGRFEDWRQE